MCNVPKTTWCPIFPLGDYMHKTFQIVLSLFSINLFSGTNLFALEYKGHSVDGDAAKTISYIYICEIDLIKIFRWKWF